jgi:DUF3102 family protein
MSAIEKTPLARLAIDIRTEVEAAEADFQSAVGHAIRAGELLTEAKRQVQHGEWLPWLAEKFPGSTRTAQGYMRLAENAEDARRVAHLGIKGALKQLAVPQDATPTPRPEAVPDGDAISDRLDADLAAAGTDHLARAKAYLAAAESHGPPPWVATLENALAAPHEPSDEEFPAVTNLAAYIQSHRLPKADDLATVEALCRAAGVLPIVLDMTDTDSTIPYVWVGYVHDDELIYHPGWADYCERMGNDRLARILADEQGES